MRNFREIGHKFPSSPVSWFLNGLNWLYIYYNIYIYKHIKLKYLITSGRALYLLLSVAIVIWSPRIMGRRISVGPKMWQALSVTMAEFESHRIFTQVPSHFTIEWATSNSLVLVPPTLTA
jgi:hypothetical protein